MYKYIYVKSENSFRKNNFKYCTIVRFINFFMFFWGLGLGVVPPLMGIFVQISLEYEESGSSILYAELTAQRFQPFKS